MDNPATFLRFKNVTLRQRNEEIFRNTNWITYSNEHWAIVGPNSSGKSTFIQAICGNIPLVTGSISYDFMPKGANIPKADIALVGFDSANHLNNEPSYYQARWNSGIGKKEITVAETLSEENIWKKNPYEIIELKDSSRHFDYLRNSVIEQLKISDLLSRNMVVLSNGERRKIDIAIALLRQPKLLILDDVFEGLDPDYRLHLDKLLQTIMEKEIRVYLVTSDPEKIPISFTHFLVINEQKVAAQGPRDSVLPVIQRIGLTNKPSSINSVDPQIVKADSDILINMHNVSVSYNDSSILTNVNWVVRRGERWALLGHNGAGKTTLLSLIMGDNPQAYANDIELFGQRRGSGESIWEIKRRIGWMAPELHRHYPLLSTCFDVVCSGWFDSVGLYRKCTQVQKEAAITVMSDLKIKRLIERQFRNISETEQRIVLLARALVKHPQLLILDEPSQGLDEQNRRFVYEILSNTHRWTESFILVTHQTQHLPKSITHQLILENGRTTTCGITENTK